MDDVQEENVAELAKNQRESDQSEAVYRKMLSSPEEYAIKESTDEKPNELEALNEEENPPKVTSKLDFLFVKLQFCQFLLFVCFVFLVLLGGGGGIGCKR